MPLPLQKQQSWVARFLYDIGWGAPLPPTIRSLTIDHDWPLEVVLSTPADYVTIAGTITTTVYAPGPDRHGMVFLATIQDAAVAVAATDVIGLFLRQSSGDGVRAWEMAGTAMIVGQMISLIGGVKIATSVGFEGARPVYVGPGQELRVVHTSVAGGATIRPRLYAVERPQSYPLRLP